MVTDLPLGSEATMKANLPGHFQGRATSLKIPVLDSNVANLYNLDLEALMKHGTIAETLQELKRQIGRTTEGVLDYLSRHDDSGSLTVIEVSHYNMWKKTGTMPYQSAKLIESAVLRASAEPTTGVNFLTRHYEQIKDSNKFYPAAEKMCPT